MCLFSVRLVGDLSRPHEHVGIGLADLMSHSLWAKTSYDHKDDMRTRDWTSGGPVHVVMPVRTSPEAVRKIVQALYSGKILLGDDAEEILILASAMQVAFSHSHARTRAHAYSFGNKNSVTKPCMTSSGGQHHRHLDGTGNSLQDSNQSAVIADFAPSFESTCRTAVVGNFKPASLLFLLCKRPLLVLMYKAPCRHSSQLRVYLGFLMPLYQGESCPYQAAAGVSLTMGMSADRGCDRSMPRVPPAARSADTSPAC